MNILDRINQLQLESKREQRDIVQAFTSKAKQIKSEYKEHIANKKIEELRTQSIEKSRRLKDNTVSEMKKALEEEKAKLESYDNVAKAFKDTLDKREIELERNNRLLSLNMILQYADADKLIEFIEKNNDKEVRDIISTRSKSMEDIERQKIQTKLNEIEAQRPENVLQRAEYIYKSFEITESYNNTDFIDTDVFFR